MYILETSGGYHCLPCWCYATVQAVVDCFLAIGGLFAGFILYSELESLCVCVWGGGGACQPLLFLYDLNK